MSEEKDLQGLEKLLGTVEGVIYQNEENGYAILDFGTQNDELITVVGTLPYVGEGDTLTLYGKENSVSLGEMHAPLRRSGKALELCLIIDRCSIEAFLDGGSVYLGGATPDTASDDTQSTLTIRTDAPCTLDVLVLHPLRSIWE